MRGKKLVNSKGTIYDRSIDANFIGQGKMDHTFFVMKLHEGHWHFGFHCQRGNHVTEARATLIPPPDQPHLTAIKAYCMAKDFIRSCILKEAESKYGVALVGISPEVPQTMH